MDFIVTYIGHRIVYNPVQMLYDEREKKNKKDSARSPLPHTL